MSGGAGGEVCLLTGATGFIGSHLARRLVSEGWRVRCLVRASSNRSALDELGVEITIGDLTDPESVRKAASGCRFVFHCGALVSDWATVPEIRQINVGGTRNVLEAAVAARAERLVHVSTTDVYGYPGVAGVAEDHTPTRFGNWYSETKRAAEVEIRRVAQANALRVVILRPATVYGPGSTEVVGEMARAMKGGHMLLIAGGRAVAGLSYIENLVDAALLAVRSDAAAGEAFNITDGLDITWRQFLGDVATKLGFPAPRLSLGYGVAYGIAVGLEQGYRLVRSATGLKTSPLLTRQAVQVLGCNQDFSNRKAREQLGWEPRVSYAAGLEATVKWLRDDYLGRRG